MTNSLTQILECVICWKISNDGLHFLHCGHSICGECVRMIPLHQCPTYQHSLTVNLDAIPVNYQLMSAWNEMTTMAQWLTSRDVKITTIVDRLSVIEDSFRFLNLNIENSVRQKVEEKMVIETVQVKQCIGELTAKIAQWHEVVNSKEQELKESNPLHQLKLEGDFVETKPELDSVKAKRAWKHLKIFECCYVLTHNRWTATRKKEKYKLRLTD